MTTKPTPETSLIEEAKKYKSAEEFVTAQKIKQEPRRSSEIIEGNDTRKIDYDIAVELKLAPPRSEINDPFPPSRASVKIKDWSPEIIGKHPTNDMAPITKAIKSKQELTNIWKKANKPKVDNEPQLTQHLNLIDNK